MFQYELLYNNSISYTSVFAHLKDHNGVLHSAKYLNPWGSDIQLVTKGPIIIRFKNSNNGENPEVRRG